MRSELVAPIGAAADQRRRGAAHRVRARIFVILALLLAVALALTADREIPSRIHVPIGHLVMFTALIALAESLQLRYFHHDEVDWLTLVEGMFAPLIFVGSGRQVVLATAVGIALASLLWRTTMLKALYRVSRWVAAASVGALVFHASAIAPTDHGGEAVALIGALVAIAVVDQILISVALLSSAGHPLESHDPGVLRIILIGRAGSLAVSAILGILTTATYMWVPWTAVLVAFPLVFLWSAGRSEAAIRADRRLLDGLQRATHHLATSLEPAAALPQCLAQARAAFEVKEVQLVLVAEQGFPTVYRCTAGPGGHAVRTEPHGLAELLADTLSAPTRLGSNGGDVAEALARMGFARGLAAPLHSGGATFGVLLFFDRQGVEGFEAGELSIAGALARELVGFLERVALVAAIEEERRKLNDIVQHSGDGIISMDTRGTILSWNSAMEAITGFAAAEMVGGRQFSLLRPRDVMGLDIDIVGWCEGYAASGQTVDLQIVTVDGLVVWLSCSASNVPARDGGLESLIIVARNITKSRELELLKDDFIAVVSHELRTPLVPIKGWAQTLLARGDRLSRDQSRAAVQSILTQAQRLEALVLNILESSRVEAGQSESLGVVDVAATASAVVADVLAARPDRLVRVDAPAHPVNVRGSSVWIDRAVANLVANAVKYSPDSAPVDLSVCSRDSTVVVSVTDRGTGIAPGSLERIFERFERLEDARKQTGTGLGLYITRRLARAMGGDVTVSSILGVGSTFVLTLPAVIDEVSGPGPGPGARTPTQRAASAEASQR